VVDSMKKAGEIVSTADAAALAQEAARRFISIGQAALRDRGGFRVALSGGSTPKALYELLGGADRSQLDWRKVQVFWGDERCVPPDHPDSNYRMAREALLTRIDIPDQNVHRLKGELDPDQAAQEYTLELQRAFQIDARQLPRFDLILLGLGPDGHTASLFPGTAAVHEQQRWVIGHHVEQLQTNRLTLTPPVLNHASHLIFLVAGSEKAAILQSVLYGPYVPDQHPAQVIAPVDGQLTWLIDQAAAAFLPN
jgi:6-phosphogluconolactonase